MTNRPHTRTQGVRDSLRRGYALDPRLNYGGRSILKDSEVTKTMITVGTIATQTILDTLLGWGLRGS